ncbi:hypothetical protein JCM11491_003841 [Sporobolomyces phaffii]
MDGVGSWKSVGSGFAPSATPSYRRATASSSSAKSTATRPPVPKQRLLFARDKTPLVTPRDSASTSRQTSATQSKLSAASFAPASNRRKPLEEKGRNRVSSATQSKRATLEFEAPEVERVANKPTASQWASSTSSNEDAQVSDSLLRTSNAKSTARWKGKLSRPSTNSVPVASSSSSRQSTARQILDTKNRRRGPTIEFDRDDVASDDDEMLGETQRRKRKRQDTGGWGKLDLIDAEDAEMAVSDDSLRGRRRTPTLDLYPSDGETPAPKTTKAEERHIAPIPYVLSRLPPPRPSAHDRSQFRSNPPQSSGSTASAEDIQARLVPYKPSARILVPDSDEISPPEHSDNDGEEPETEADDEEQSDHQRRRMVDTKALATKKRGERSDDSGFVDMIDLSHSSSPALPDHSDRDVTEDLVSVPDSQPSVASHLSYALGSSPPPSSSSVTILEPVAALRPPPRRATLQPTESDILMPPPPLNPAPRRRLRRGAPPRNQNPSPSLASPHPTSSRVLVEDTQPRSPPRPFLSSQSNPYRIFCEETQDDDECDPEMEALRRWNELHTRLPSDLPTLDSDQIVLPSPKPLRPSKLVAPRALSPPLGRLEEDAENRVVSGAAAVASNEGGGDVVVSSRPVATTGEWSALTLAWEGDKPLSPPPPPAPRQARLTNYFALDRVESSHDDHVVIEDSQAPTVGVGLEMGALERAVRDSIHGLGGRRAELRRVPEDEEQLGEATVDTVDNDSVCSSPLSSLSPSLPPSSSPLNLPAGALLDDEPMRDAVSAADDEEEDVTVLESDPEDSDGPSLCHERRRKAAISPLGARTKTFPRYVLPQSVVDFGRASVPYEEGDEEVERTPPSRREDEGQQDDSEAAESMWESYWTVGSAPRLDDADDESKTAAALLLEQAPEVDLPPGWYQNEDGELVRGGFGAAEGDESDEGEL